MDQCDRPFLELMFSRKKKKEITYFFSRNASLFFLRLCALRRR